MLKRVVLAVVAVFVAWWVLDLLIHGVLLGSTYAATAHLWRPMEEMNRGLMALVGLVGAVAFVAVYAYLIRPKCPVTGLIYGALFGLGVGVSMGYGTYCVMPIPHRLALAWFLGALVEAVVGGLLVGLIVKETGEPETGCA